MTRSVYFDYLRGVAILMVIAIHCYVPYISECWSHLIRNIFNCAVPLFFAISGYFLSQKKMRYSDLIKKQVPKVYIPMLVWSLPFLITNLIAGKASWHSLMLFFIGGYGVFYFITVMIQFYVLLPVMIKVADTFKSGGVILTLVISEISVAIVTYYNIVSGMHLPLILYAGIFPLWSVFYYVGVYLGRHSDRQYGILFPLMIAVVGISLSLLESEYLLANYGGGLGIKPSSFIFSLAVIFFLFSVKTEKFVINIFGIENKVLSSLGKASFGIYLIHLHIVKRLPSYISDSWPLKWIITAVLTILLVELLRRIVPAKSYKYLGI